MVIFYKLLFYIVSLLDAYLLDLLHWIQFNDVTTERGQLYKIHSGWIVRYVCT